MGNLTLESSFFGLKPQGAAINSCRVMTKNVRLPEVRLNPTNPLDGNATKRSKLPEPIRSAGEYRYSRRAFGEAERLKPFSSFSDKESLRPCFWLTRVLRFPQVPQSGLTQTSISPQRRKIEEDFWYPQKALEEADRLTPVPTPSASKRHRPKFEPIRFELIPTVSEVDSTKTPISPRWKRNERKLWYPRRAFGEAERLTPVSSFSDEKS